ncbi:MAG: hypothetical protein IJO85_07445 [Lachnospiraceae bacterium]|nr:hypothetical protein [Lachnospiraceae bacterium]
MKINGNYSNSGYYDGKDRQGVQRDIPTLSVMHINVEQKEIIVLNTIRGERAKGIYEELTGLFG